MSRFSRNKQSNNGVSAIVGVLVLVLLVLVLSAGVLFTASNMLGEQPTDMTAGTTTERITDYEYETQLVSQGNAQTVEVVSPLGTHYKLNQVGDATRILAVAPNGNQSQVRDMRVVGLESESNRKVNDEDAVDENSEEQVLERKPVKNGINSDVIVDKYGTGDYKSIQTAINNVDTAVNHPITEDNPAVIVVERAVYKENLDVSQNISLIAEHGTVIEDAEPNENVVNIKGDNVGFRNFNVDADPVEGDSHYGLHGINVEGTNTRVVGNHVYNATSPDLTSAGLNVDGSGTVMKFNSVENNERSVQFDNNAELSYVCGNQFQNTVAGSISQANLNQIATENYWKDGLPVTLIPEDASQDDEAWRELTQKQRVLESNNKVPVTEIPADVGRAGQSFPGTKLQAGNVKNCELSIQLTHIGNNSFQIDDLKVEVESRNTTLDIVVKDTVTYETGGGAEKRTESRWWAQCTSGCEDNTLDPRDSIELKPINKSLDTNPVEVANSVDIVRSGGGGSGGSSGGGGGVDQPTGNDTETLGPTTVTLFHSQTEEVEKEPVETQTFQIILGKTVEVQLADRVTLSTAVSGADGEVGYEWSLGDGTNKSGKQVSHLYEDPGTYQVCLYAWDKATDEDDYDCTQVTVDEGKKDLAKIRQEEKETLQQRIDEAKENKVIYLEEGSYDSLNIKVPDLTVIGSGDVNIQEHASITAEDVTVKNVDFENGVSVYQDGVKLWKVAANNPTGYAVEIDSAGSKLAYIGQSELTGRNGISLNTDTDVTLQNNEITATGPYGVQVGERMNGVRITGNTISSDEYGIYRGHASTMYLEDNTINTLKRVYRVANQPPNVNSVSQTALITDSPIEFSASVSDPQGDRVTHILWSIEDRDRTVKLSPSENFRTSFDTSGDYNITVRPVDEFGKSGKYVETISVEKFKASVESREVIGVGSSFDVNVNTNLPSDRLYSFKYDWGDGEESRLVPYQSRSHVYENTGKYTVEVTVESDSGKTAVATKEIEVRDTPVPAVSVESGDDEEIGIDESVTLNASSSFLPSGTIEDATIKWDFDRDGDSDATGVTVEKSWSSLGEKKFDVTITDSAGLVGTRTLTKEVSTYDLDVEGDRVALVDSNQTIRPEVGISSSRIDRYEVRWSDSGSFSSYETAPINHTYTTKGTYNITVRTVTTDGYEAVGTLTTDIIEDNFDDKSLQQMVNAADAGDEIVVPPGIYNHTVLNKSVTLAGAGDSSSVKGLKITANGVTVKDMQASKRVNVRASGVSLNRFTAEASSSWGVAVYKDDVSITNSEVTSPYGVFSNAQYTTIVDSTVTTDNRAFQFQHQHTLVKDTIVDAGGHGIYLRAPDYRTVKNTTIVNSDITAGGHGFRTATAWDAKVVDTTLRDSTFDVANKLVNVRQSRYNEYTAEGTLTIEGGSHAFNVVSQTYDSDVTDVTVSETQMTTQSGNGPTLKYDSSYLSEQDKIRFSGSSYTVTSSDALTASPSIFGTDITFDSVDVDKDSGYAYYIKGKSAHIKSADANSAGGVRISGANARLENMNITADGTSLNIRESGLRVVDSTVDGGTRIAYMRAGDYQTVKNISFKRTELRTDGHGFQLSTAYSSDFGQVTIEDTTIDMQGSLFRNGPNWKTEGFKAKGNIMLLNGSGVFNLVTKSYTENTELIRITETGVNVVSGTGASFKYEQGYLSSQDSLRFKGTGYTLESATTLDSTLVLAGQQITARDMTIDKSSGYGAKVTGEGNTIKNFDITAPAGVYSNAEYTSVFNSQIDTSGLALHFRKSHGHIKGTSVTAGGDAIYLNAGDYVHIKNTTLEDSTFDVEGHGVKSRQRWDSGVDSITLDGVTLDIQGKVLYPTDSRHYGTAYIETVNVKNTITVYNGSKAFSLVTKSYKNSVDAVKVTQDKMTVTEGTGATLDYSSSYFDSLNAMRFYGNDYDLTATFDVPSQIQLKGNNIHLSDTTVTRDSGYAIKITGNNAGVTSVTADSGIYSSSKRTHIKDTTIVSSGTGVQLRGSHSLVKNTDITAGGTGLYLRAGSETTNITYDSLTVDAKKGIQTSYGYGGSLSDITVRDVTFDVTRYVLQDGHNINNLKPEGTITVNHGSHAFSLVTRAYQSQVDSVTVTDTKLSSDSGNGPTLEYSSNYLSSQNAIRFYGSNYKIKTTLTLPTQVQLYGEQLTLVDTTTSQSNTYAVKTYGKQTTLKSVTLDGGLRADGVGTQIHNSEITSTGTGIRLLKKDARINNVDITSDGYGVYMVAGDYVTIKNVTFEDSTITSNSHGFATYQRWDAQVASFTVDDVKLNVKETVLREVENNNYGKAVVGDIIVKDTFTIQNGYDAIDFYTRSLNNGDASEVTLKQSTIEVTGGTGPTLAFYDGYITGEDELSLYGQDYTFTTTQSSVQTPTNVYGNNITVSGFG